MFLYRYTLPLSKEAQKSSKLPLAMEFPVDKLCNPVLVSGAKRPNVWLPKHHGIVRAAIRDSKDYEIDILDAVSAMGLQADWGNVHNCDLAGYKDCIKHLRHYDLDKISAISSNEEHLVEIDKLGDKDITTECQEWVPEDCVVFVPFDRQFLGFVVDLTIDKILYVVQNPSRGLAIAR